MKKFAEKFCGKIFAVTDTIGRLDAVISSTLLFAIVLISLWGVITRYFLGHPSAWVGELSLALFVWLVFFGLSSLARRGEIVKIAFMLRFFPKKAAFLLGRILSPALFALSLAVIIALGLRLVGFAHERYTSILRIPYSVVYLGIPLGSAFTLYHVLRHAVIGPRFFEEGDGE